MTPYGGHDSILTGKGSRKELTRMDLGEEGLQNRRRGPGVAADTGNSPICLYLIPGCFWEMPLLSFLFCCPSFIFLAQISYGNGLLAENMLRRCAHMSGDCGELTFLHCHLIPP